MSKFIDRTKEAVELLRTKVWFERVLEAYAFSDVEYDIITYRAGDVNHWRININTGEVGEK